MSDITYSIVIPTFRRGGLLTGCLESILALAYPKNLLEVIVVDNGGGDHTAAVAAPFAGRLSLRYLVNDRNRGYGYSVNRGILAAAGRNIMFLNDDARPASDLLLECDRLRASDRQMAIHKGGELAMRA